MLDGLRGEHSIAELCRREVVAESLYYNWSKEFLEAGKKRLAGDTARAATSDEVKVLHKEARDFKEVVAEQALELRLLKKSMIADGGGPHPRSWRSSGWSSSRACRRGARCKNLTFHGRPSVAGMIASSLAVSTRWRIAGPGRTGFGTAFPRRREIRSSSWR